MGCASLLGSPPAHRDAPPRPPLLLLLLLLVCTPPLNTAPTDVIRFAGSPCAAPSPAPATDSEITDPVSANRVSPPPSSSSAAPPRMNVPKGSQMQLRGWAGEVRR